MADLLMALLLVAVLLAPIALWLRRATEFFAVGVSQGRVEHVRGRVPKRLIDDFTDVLTRARVQTAELRVVSEDGRPALRVKGAVSSDAQQQLRNVLGKYGLAELRAGARPPPRRRS
ncbi:MAG TPA: DUF3634 family protein [Polyangiaceae bacterium]|nr:DUF3634 family protein [Polyangiaceae bacterium]